MRTRALLLLMLAGCHGAPAPDPVPPSGGAQAHADSGRMGMMMRGDSGRMAMMHGRMRRDSGGMMMRGDSGRMGMMHGRMRHDSGGMMMRGDSGRMGMMHGRMRRDSGGMMMRGDSGRMGMMHGARAEGADFAGVPSPPPQCSAVSPALVEEGREVFTGRGNCTLCHGADARGTGMAPDLTDGAWLHGDGSYPFIASVVAAGVIRPLRHPGAMPPRGGANLSAEEVCAVAAYVYSRSHRAP